MTNGHMLSFSKDRVEIFSDAVIAIALTLLVLELHPPEIHEHASIGQYLSALDPLWPKFASFVLTFITISIHWVSHHYFFRHIGRATLGLVWLNNIFLLFICFLPFPTAMLGNNPSDLFPVFFFAINSLLLALTFMALRMYAVKKNLFLKSGYTNLMGPKHSLPAVSLYAFSAAIAWVNTYLSLICLLIVPFLYFAPNVIQAIRSQK